MHKSKIIDCITFFDNNFMFKLRYNVYLKIDHFIVCDRSLITKEKERKKVCMEGLL